MLGDHVAQGLVRYLTWNSPTTIPSAPSLLCPPASFTWAGFHASLLLYFRPLRGRRPPEPSTRPPRILRAGVGTPTARQRRCLRNASFDSFSCAAANPNPFSDSLRQVPSLARLRGYWQKHQKPATRCHSFPLHLFKFNTTRPPPPPPAPRPPKAIIFNTKTFQRSVRSTAHVSGWGPYDLHDL